MNGYGKGKKGVRKTGPAGSGVPGMSSSNVTSKQEHRVNRKIVGLKQIKGKDGVVRGVWITKARKPKKKSRFIGSSQRGKIANIRASTRASMAAKGDASSDRANPAYFTGTVTGTATTKKPNKSKNVYGS